MWYVFLLFLYTYALKFESCENNDLESFTSRAPVSVTNGMTAQCLNTMDIGVLESLKTMKPDLTNSFAHLMHEVEFDRWTTWIVNATSVFKLSLVSKQVPFCEAVEDFSIFDEESLALLTEHCLYGIENSKMKDVNPFEHLSEEQFKAIGPNFFAGMSLKVARMIPNAFWEYMTEDQKESLQSKQTVDYYFQKSPDSSNADPRLEGLRIRSDARNVLRNRFLRNHPCRHFKTISGFPEDLIESWCDPLFKNLDLIPFTTRLKIAVVCFIVVLTLAGVIAFNRTKFFGEKIKKATNDLLLEKQVFEQDPTMLGIEEVKLDPEGATVKFDEESPEYSGGEKLEGTKVEFSEEAELPEFSGADSFPVEKLDPSITAPDDVRPEIASSFANTDVTKSESPQVEMNEVSENETETSDAEEASSESIDTEQSDDSEESTDKDSNLHKLE